ncbi:amidohydrolase family protein [Pseudonocardia xishanensis]|uniref:Amidohydrolase-related domain-containing protein n=1 Tax=Pseudonocardia xishanensis TaxID=630995 RepID=A0ABP8RVJ8_9PSEU
MTLTSPNDIIDVDIDSHEMAPLHMWGPMFGEHSDRFAKILEPAMSRFGASANNFDRPGLTDTAPITAETVWNERGPGAPGAFDFDRRLAVLDAMGTETQLVFPSGAMTAFGALLGGELRQTFLSGLEYDDYAPIIEGLIDEYNAWAARETTARGNRLRFVALLHGANPAEMITNTEALLAQGIRALHLPSGIPPAGVSPADHALHPLWRMIADADAAVVTHVAGQTGFLASAAWNQAPEFAPGKVESTEVGFEPLSMSVVHAAAVNYLSAMILGGVFERFPTLRFGVLEFGAYWVGHLAETLDVWGTRVFRKRVSGVLSAKPSEYLARNVRVSPFPFEDTRSYFERHPAVADCFAYCSDYPHVEGGISQKQVFFDQLQPLGDDVLRRFFSENGRLLTP